MSKMISRCQRWETWQRLAASAFIAVSLLGHARAEEATGSAAAMFDDVYQILSEKGLQIDEAAARTAALEAVLRTADPEGQIVTPERRRYMDLRTSGQVYSLGVRLSMTNGMPVLTEVESGGPAEAAGLKPGDRLLAANGEDLSYTDIVRASGLLRGHEPAAVALTVLSPDGDTNAVEVVRRLLQLPAIETAEALPTGLCYLKLNGLFDGTGKEVVDIIQKWRDDAQVGLILDLRGANGLDLESARQIATLYAEANMMLFSFRDQDDQDIEVYKAGTSAPLDMPTMVLIDGDTTGAAEVLAASLKRSIRGAMILGAPSRGDPCIRDAVQLPACEIYVATRKLVTADGTTYAGTSGVKPDVVVPPGATTTYESDESMPGREKLPEEVEDIRLHVRVRGDSALRRAADILLGLKALNIRGISVKPDRDG